MDAKVTVGIVEFKENMGFVIRNLFLVIARDTRQWCSQQGGDRGT
jgi:hypothetical protein